MKAPLPWPDEEAWRASLLAEDTGRLLAAARNYLGPVRTPYDKRDIVSRLAAFLRRPDSLESLLSLLDEEDARVLGTLFLRGPATEEELRSLFAGELPLFDLGIRIANLQDRLILFRFEARGRRLLAPCPLLAPALEELVVEPGLLFGAASAPKAAPAAPAFQEGADPALAAAALFALLAHSPGCIRKGGGLSKRGAERVRAFLPEELRGGQAEGDRVELLVSAFTAAGLLPLDGESRLPDAAAFAALAEAEGDEFLLFLVAALRRESARSRERTRIGAAGATGAANAAEPGGSACVDSPGAVRDPDERRAVSREAAVLGALLGAAPEGMAFSRHGFVRFLRIGAGRLHDQGDEVAGDAARAIAADADSLLAILLGLGLALRHDGAEGLVRLRRSAVAAAPDAALAGASDGAEAGPGEAPAESGVAHPVEPVLVAEGSHALHLLPEADIAARAFLGRLATPTSFGRAWSWEIDRESLRRAFAGGLSASQAIERLEDLAGRPLPQSLVFSIRDWEEEYRSLRLYRGMLLAADDRLRAVVENSRVLAPLIAERLGPGLYLLAAGDAEAAEALREAGLEPPPVMRAHRHAPEGAPVPGGAPAVAGGGLQRGALAAALSVFPRLAAAGAPRVFRPEARRSALLAALLPPAVREGGIEGRGAGASPNEAAPAPGNAFGSPTSVAVGAAAVAAVRERARELADRVGRGLVLTERQLEVADVHPDRNEATGMDYAGKVRLVERALRSPGDRLEILYRPPRGPTGAAGDPGDAPVRALLRPVRLEKAEKGLVLEAEDLATGSPVRIPLGAASSVRRIRASIFGEDA